MSKIGILGGSFDPIHYGHLILAESARENLNLDKIVFIPTGNHPFKGFEQVDAIHRYNMTKLAIGGNTNFEISPIEVSRDGMAYTIDTINELKSVNPDGDYYFITGADIIFQLEKWKKTEELLCNVKIATAFRPGYDEDRLDKKIRELKELYGASVLKVKTPEIELSSSDIRERIRQGKSIKYLVPGKVEEYIYANRLYFN